MISIYSILGVISRSFITIFILGVPNYIRNYYCADHLALCDNDKQIAVLSGIKIRVRVNEL